MNTEISWLYVSIPFGVEMIVGKVVVCLSASHDLLALANKVIRSMVLK